MSEMGKVTLNRFRELVGVKPNEVLGEGRYSFHEAKVLYEAGYKIVVDFCYPSLGKVNFYCGNKYQYGTRFELEDNHSYCFIDVPEDVKSRIKTIAELVK